MDHRRLPPVEFAPPEVYARFVHFRTEGRLNPKVGSATLGAGYSVAGIVCAVELRFDIITDVFEEYKIRRWIEDEHAWQKIGGRFARFHTSSGIDDTPDPYSPNQFRPPDIYDYDSPGIPITEVISRSVLVQDGVLSDPRAAEVVWVLNFRDWVEGRRGQHWRRISQHTRWTSILAVQWRDDSTPARWHPTPRMSASLGRTRVRPAGTDIVLECLAG
jgi:hypothetical protein